MESRKPAFNLDMLRPWASHIAVALGGAALAVGAAHQMNGLAESPTPVPPIAGLPAEKWQPPVFMPQPPKPPLKPIQQRNNPGCTWITNKPSGYYIGQACGGDTLVKLHNSFSKKYDFGVIKHSGRLICGWVKSDLLETKRRGAPASICLKYYRQQNNRAVIGEDFNGGNGERVDGTPMEVAQNCDHHLYRNFASAKPSPTNLHPSKSNSGFYDYVGKEKGTVKYRFTYKYSDSRHSKAIDVSSYKTSWGYMKLGCKSGHPRGGTPKTRLTVPGSHPNALIKR
jgi:hypothetical protein